MVIPCFILAKQNKQSSKRDKKWSTRVTYLGISAAICYQNKNAASHTNGKTRYVQ